MAPRRSAARAWLPALSAPVVLLALLFAMWALNKASFGGDSAPARSDAPLWRWLLETNNAFWGPTPFASTNGGRVIAATVVSAAVVFVVGYLATWRSIAGLRAGSSAWPAFLATWAALTVACVLGAVADWLIATRDVSFRGAGQAQFAVLTNGLQYGAKYGWIAALLSTLIWMVVRPAPDPPRRDGVLGPPVPYPAEREGYFRTHGTRGEALPAAEPDYDRDEDAHDASHEHEAEHDTGRLAALRAQVEAEAEAETAPSYDPLEPRPNPTPPSLLDQHRPAPAPAFTREYAPEPLAPPTSEPVDESSEEPEESTPYVGRRARSVYDPASDVPPVVRPPGSHRG